jgi:hypothetical protein
MLSDSLRWVAVITVTAGCAGKQPVLTPRLELESRSTLAPADSTCSHRPSLSVHRDRITLAGRFSIPEAGGGMGAVLLPRGGGISDRDLVVLLYTVGPGALMMVEERCYVADIGPLEPGHYRVTVGSLLRTKFGTVRADSLLNAAVSVGDRRGPAGEPVAAPDTPRR